MNLNRADIIDIANGYRNTYVDSQDKGELLCAVADKYLKATENINTITLAKIEDIWQLLPSDDKYNRIWELLGEIEGDLQSVIE